ncbi:fatty acid desaturase domain-containing protein [Artemisia annua]|uniref:Fatty acid desaturase domain-containing protein n=1 Tax=Artemisia annua TaxID=35608 RepID=A0A2U1MW48_ARTAN|nr:fatty acid desaturase domain-containing protein [Artemisia annua]
MGAGGQMNVSIETDILQRVPVFKPPFRIADLRKQIPPHRFKRSLIRSLGSFFRDLFSWCVRVWPSRATSRPSMPAPKAFTEHAEKVDFYDEAFQSDDKSRIRLRSLSRWC